MPGGQIAIDDPRAADVRALLQRHLTAFAPARSLYARAGFVACGPFAEYRPSPHNTFMTLSLGAAAEGRTAPGAGPRATAATDR